MPQKCPTLVKKFILLKDMDMEAKKFSSDRLVLCWGGGGGFKNKKNKKKKKNFFFFFFFKKKTF